MWKRSRQLNNILYKNTLHTLIIIDKVLAEIQKSKCAYDIKNVRFNSTWQADLPIQIVGWDTWIDACNTKSEAAPLK